MHRAGRLLEHNLKDITMKFPHWVICGAIGAGALSTILLAGRLLSAEPSSGKSKAKAKSGANSLKALDARVEKLESTMLREIVEISNLYEDAGEFERAKSLLEVLLKLNPDFPGLKKKVEELDKKSFDAYGFEFALDTSRGWVPVGGAVVKGRPVHVEVEGDYRFNVSANITADGFPSSDPMTDYVEGVPCGALMAMVAVKGGKPGRPVPLKANQTWTPQEDGMLLLRINAPAGHKCTGKLTVKLSGLIRPE